MNVRERLAVVCERMNRAAESVNRDSSSITLIAVSKTQPTEAIRELYDLGVRDFGESKLQEAIPKIEALPSDIVWHFIGHLQSNKAKRCAEYFPVVHSISSESQLREIDKGHRSVHGFLEINIAHEEKKSGIDLNSIDQFLSVALQYKQTNLRGLMTVGPNVQDATAMRPYFRSIADAATRIGLPWISMGMSSDFEVGIQEGATHVRVGSALFGARGS
jgi:pyridoxal phosphate enzyme (YggS family)